MKTHSDAQLHELARKRVDFRAHLVVYFVTNAALWTIWFLTGQGYIWPVWPMAGWGIGVIFHYLFDYRPSGFLSEEEEYQKLKRELEEHKHLV
jgi:hypothetical protein